MKSFLKKFVRKFYFAFAGLFHGVTQDHSIRLQAILGLIVVIVSLFLSLSLVEWLWIIAMVLLVLAAEFVNSCIEKIVDVLFPLYDPTAKTIKDYAAAFVLLTSMLAAMVGMYIIGGHVWQIIT